MVPPGMSVRVTLADALESTELVAVMVMSVGLAIVPGAVYSPELLMDPVEGEMDHLTPVAAVPLTVAVNCLVVPACTQTRGLGSTCTVTP